jgi:preprotein translocase subunit SecD
MNRYPLWKYSVIAIALLLGAIYTAPNFFGESPAVQVSSAKPTVKIDTSLVSRVEDVLRGANIDHRGISFDVAGLSSTVRARFDSPDEQLRAKDVLQKALNPDPADESYVVALNLVSRTPAWLASLRALPMYLGLDLRGGVHFLMQVDMKAAIDKRMEALTGDVRTLLRGKNVRHAGIARQGQAIQIKFRDEATRQQASGVIRDNLRELALREERDGDDFTLVATLSPAAQKDIQDNALKQNITRVPTAS